MRTRITQYREQEQGRTQPTERQSKRQNRKEMGKRKGNNKKRAKEGRKRGEGDTAIRRMFFVLVPTGLRPRGCVSWWFILLV